jgi:uncharacterized membrane-anchored protein
MSAAVTRALLALGVALVLGVVSYSIVGKERIIASGDVIYLELAPVDPRSLMQGDYMALRFQLAAAIEEKRAGASRERSAALDVDARRVATFDPTGQSPVRIDYRLRNGRVWLGTNAFFFAEGDAERYAGKARYGEFRLDRASGEAVLVGLADENLRRL